MFHTLVTRGTTTHTSLIYSRVIITQGKFVLREEGFSLLLTILIELIICSNFTSTISLEGQLFLFDSQETAKIYGRLGKIELWVTIVLGILLT